MEDISGTWRRAQVLKDVSAVERIVRAFPFSDRSPFKYGVLVAYSGEDSDVIRVIGVERQVAYSMVCGKVMPPDYALLSTAARPEDVISEWESVPPQSPFATVVFGWQRASLFRQASAFALQRVVDAALYARNASATERVYASSLSNTLCVNGISQAVEKVILAAQALSAPRA